MKKSLLPVLTILFFLTSTAFFIDNYVVKKNTAEVDQIEGFYIFSDCKPVNEYEYLGTVSSNTGGFGGTQYEQVRDRLIKKVKKEYPKADAIILTLQYGRADKADAIIFKE